MADGSVFRHGAVQYPLTTATTNHLLRDADPAIYFALDFFAASLRKYIGPRLAAQALLEQLKLVDAVAKTIHVEPSPFLLAHEMRFPLLSLYRKTEEEHADTVVFNRDRSEWEFSYVLPSLSPRATEQLHPILRAAARVIARAARTGRDPDINAGASAWAQGGIKAARVTRASYGVYEPVDGDAKVFRAVVGTIEVYELDASVEDTFETLNGVSGTMAVAVADGTSVDVATTATYPAPTITSIVPSLGTKAGGTTIVINGTGFRVGTPVSVIIGDTSCSNAEVLSSTQVRAVTGAHEAYPTSDADVVVIAHDGQQATLPMAYQFTTP